MKNGRSHTLYTPSTTPTKAKTPPKRRFINNLLFFPASTTHTTKALPSPAKRPLHRWQSVILRNNDRLRGRNIEAVYHTNGRFVRYAHLAGDVAGEPVLPVLAQTGCVQRVYQPGLAGAGDGRVREFPLNGKRFKCKYIVPHFQPVFVLRLYPEHDRHPCAHNCLTLHPYDCLMLYSIFIIKLTLLEQLYHISQEKHIFMGEGVADLATGCCCAGRVWVGEGNDKKLDAGFCLCLFTWFFPTWTLDSPASETRYHTNFFDPKFHQSYSITIKQITKKPRLA